MTLRRSFVWNALGALLPGLISLITVPIYIHLIGTPRYGIVSITWLLLGYFGFLDFGLSRASSNALSRCEVRAERRCILATALVLNACLGVLGGAIMLVSARWLLGHAFHLSGPVREEAVAVCPWIAAMLPLGLLYGVGSGALESRERFGLSNALGTGGTVLGQVVPLLCAATLGPSLAVVVPAALLTRLGITVLLFATVLRTEGAIRLADFRRAWMRALLGYGSWVTVSSAAAPILETFDQMLIGTVLGASAVAHYTVPMNLAVRSQFAAAALSRSLFPRLSRVDAAEGRATTRAALVSLAYGFGAICGPAIVVCGLFLKLWVGRQFGAAAAPIGAILLFGAWINGLAFLPFSLIQAQRRPDLTGKLQLVQIVPFLAVVWLFMHLAGLPGAAVAWSLRAGVEAVVLYFLSGCASRDGWRLLPAVGLMLGATGVALAVPMSALVAVGAAAALGCAFVLTGAAIDAELNQIGRAMLRRWMARPVNAPVR